MLNRLNLNKALWGLTSVIALISALIGVANPRIYTNLILLDFLPGTVSQDIVTAILALLVLIWLPQIKERCWKKQIIVIGIMSYFWYGYGIWVIEQVYTPLYLLYLAVFGLSFYSMVLSVVSIRQEAVDDVQLPKPIQHASAGWALLNPIIFFPLWISELLPLMAGEAAGNAYSIYILDLCFVMPALAILAIMAIRGNGLGLLLIPALFIKGFTLLFSVALGPLIAPFLDLVGKKEEVPFYLGLSVVFLVLSLLHLSTMRISIRGGSEIEGQSTGVDVYGK